jgi:hypothetical protein
MPHERDPITEGWLRRGAPMDYLGTHEGRCPRCDSVSLQDSYRVILGSWSGIGAPFFVRPFLRRSSTAGKIGAKSVWNLCQSCGSFLPLDADAANQAVELGLPAGFINR